MWDIYQVTWSFVGRLCGSVPQDPEAIRKWLESRAPAKIPDEVLEGEAPTLDDLEEEVLETIQPAEGPVTLGFQRDGAGHLFIRDGSIKAHLKDCANQLQKLLVIKALRSKVANTVFPEPSRVILLRDGNPVTNEDGFFSRPVHVLTPRGPRNALKIIRYVEKPTVTFQLRVLQKSEVTQDVLRAIMEYGGVHGFGGERGMGEGKYQFVFEEVR